MASCSFAISISAWTPGEPNAAEKGERCVSVAASVVAASLAPSIAPRRTSLPAKANERQWDEMRIHDKAPYSFDAHSN
eukprot:scaffold85080_cov31-Tisochrysis_lutea.AAC.8